MTANLWLPVVTASSTSLAVELAALLPPCALLELPCEVEELPPRARANLAAVSRALQWTLPGVPPPPTASSHRVGNNRDVVPRRDNGENDDVLPAREGSWNARQQQREPGPPGTGGSHVPALATTVALIKKPLVAESAPVASHDALTSLPTIAEDEALFSSEMAHAASLVHWSRHSPHTAPPPAAITAVLSAAEPTSILRATIPAELPVEAASALLTAIVARCGARVASALAETVVLTRISTLTAPAPRDLMKALVGLAEAHWRAAVPLYSLLSSETEASTVSGPTAEVLVRIAGVLDPRGAKEALLTCCSALWGEEGVRVVEALLSKCKSEVGVAAAIVAGLELNVRGMEKSLRFGKLLHVCVKDVPEIATAHADIVRRVASKSTVYLAKRAIALLAVTAVASRDSVEIGGDG
jgi:Fanconi Anaemia group E protein FANCE